MDRSLAAGASFGLDLDDKRNQNRVGMPHPEIFQSLSGERFASSCRVWVCLIITHEPHDIADVTANGSRIALLRIAHLGVPPLADGEREEH